MSKVTLKDVTIKTDKKRESGIKVSELSGDFNLDVKDYALANLKESGKGEYDVVKSRFGPLAVTDSERLSREQKDRRFRLNPLLREPLSVEQEELRVIDKKVQEKVDSISELIKADSVSLGYKEGFKKGYEESYKKFENEGKESLAKFVEFVHEMEAAKIEIFKVNERILIDMVFRIAKMVLLRELTTDREYILRLAKELVNKSGTRDNITLRINPSEAKTVEMLKEGLMKSIGSMSNLNIEVSSQVNQGGCQIETEWNAIDASIEMQLDGIDRALFGKRVEGQ